MLKLIAMSKKDYGMMKTFALLELGRVWVAGKREKLKKAD